MNTNNNVPELRFKGFEGEWKDITFASFYRVSSGYAFKASDYVKDGVAIINGESIQNGGILSKNLKFLPTFFRESYSNFLLNSGDIVLGLNRPVTNGLLKIARIPNELDGSLLYQRAGKIVFNSKIDLNFSFVALEKEVLLHTLSESVGSDQPFISTSKLNEWEMLFPECDEEQTAIGNTFQQLDSLINQHQQKHNKLCNIKQAMLQKMFPQQGQTMPQIRFKGFEGEWVERELGEIGDTFTGLAGKTKDDFGHGQGRFVTYMNVFSNSISNKNLVEPIEVDENQNEVKKGDVFFTTSSETPEEVGMSSVWMGNTRNVYLNSFCFGYRPKQMIDSFYLAYILRASAFRKQVIFLAQGVSRYNISKTKVMDIKICIPSFSEQEKIGNYFQKLDTLINQHQQQITKLNNIKQACLSKMFV